MTKYLQYYFYEKRGCLFGHPHIASASPFFKDATSLRSIILSLSFSADPSMLKTKFSKRYFSNIFKFA